MPYPALLHPEPLQQATADLYLLSEVKSLSHVQLFATPWTVAYQAPPSMGFSRQEYRSAVPLSSLSESEVTHSCLTLCNPIDGNPTGSSVPRILQARILA